MSDGSHGCHANATCLDTDTGYTCTCNPGFDDENLADPGKNCVRTNECCQIFNIFKTGTFYNAICVYKRTQLSGFLDYECHGNPSIEDHWWNFPMAVQYAAVHLHEYFFKNGLTINIVNYMI